MTNQAERNNAIQSALANAFMQRADDQEFKGKDRDRRAIEFFAGAVHALKLANDPAWEQLARVTALVIAPRGYKEVQRMAIAQLESSK